MIGRRKKQETERMAEPAEAQKLPFGYEAYTWLHDVVSCLAFVMILFVFFLRLIGVSGPSMTPTLLNGDRVILLSNFLYQDVEAGDIVVMQIPTFDEEPIVKRVIAKGGQTVDIDFEAGAVYVDGVMLQENYINDLTHLSYTCLLYTSLAFTGKQFGNADRGIPSDGAGYRLGKIPYQQRTHALF